MALHQIQELLRFKPALKKDQCGAAEFCHKRFNMKSNAVYVQQLLEEQLQ